MRRNGFLEKGDTIDPANEAHFLPAGRRPDSDTKTPILQPRIPNFPLVRNLYGLEMRQFCVVANVN